MDPTGLLNVEGTDLQDTVAATNRNNGTYEDHYYDKETNSIRTKTMPLIDENLGAPLKIDLDNEPIIGPIVQIFSGIGETSTGVALTGLSGGLASGVGGSLAFDGVTRVLMGGGLLINDFVGGKRNSNLPHSAFDSILSTGEVIVGRDTFGTDGPGKLRQAGDIYVDAFSGYSSFTQGDTLGVALSIKDTLIDTYNLLNTDSCSGEK